LSGFNKQTKKKAEDLKQTMDAFISGIEAYIQTNPWLAVAMVFVGGLLSASSPCVLAMIPLMMGFVAGRKEGDNGLLRGLAYSFVFVLGLCVTFVGLGMGAALAGSIYGEHSAAWNWIVAVVCIVMGIHLMSLFEFSLPVPSFAQPRIRGFVGAFVLGLLFGVVSTPCAAPLLVVVLTYLAGSGASVFYGGVLLLAYALGHSVLILVAGTSMGAARSLIESKKMTAVTAVLRRVSGGVIVIVGLYFGYCGMK
jgi:cytochrome c-type biogenesis protein